MNGVVLKVSLVSLHFKSTPFGNRSTLHSMKGIGFASLHYYSFAFIREANSSRANNEVNICDLVNSLHNR